MDYSNIKLNENTEQEFIDLLKNTSPSDILSLFFNTQSQRAAIYTRFNNGFKQFLENNNEEEYQKLCSSVSNMISKISKEIIHIEDALREPRPKWSSLIHELRESEKSKFILTTQQQILKAEIHANSLTKKDEDGNEFTMPTSGCYQEHIDLCNQNLAVCNQQLAQCINDINEKLEELQYELQDEPEDQPSNHSHAAGCQHDHHH